MFHCLPLNKTNSISLRNLRTVSRIKQHALPIPKFQKRLDIVIMGSPNAGIQVVIFLAIRFEF